jgi:hypothetical protein
MFLQQNDLALDLALENDGKSVVRLQYLSIFDFCGDKDGIRSTPVSRDITGKNNKLVQTFRDAWSDIFTWMKWLDIQMPSEQQDAGSASTRLTAFFKEHFLNTTFFYTH